jgi:hypothetical protein
LSTTSEGVVALPAAAQPVSDDSSPNIAMHSSVCLIPTPNLPGWAFVATLLFHHNKTLSYHVV